MWGKRNHQADPCLRPPFCYPSGFIAIKRDVEYGRSLIEPIKGFYSLHSFDNHLVKASKCCPPGIRMVESRGNAD